MYVATAPAAIEYGADIGCEFFKSDHVHDFDCTYLRTGVYEGLRYSKHPQGINYPWPITGRIGSARQNRQKASFDNLPRPYPHVLGR